jgi:glyceraldehyde-3-phosphate dehydrogenase (NADP+)
MEGMLMPEPRKFFVNGKWEKSKTIKKVINPYNNEIVGKVCFASAENLENAVRAAENAFKTTKKQPPSEQAEILKKVTGGIKEQKEKLANIIVQETGKPITLALGEVGRAITTFELAAKEAEEITRGNYLRLGSDIVSFTKRFPVGPILGIAPFNFPLNLVAHKIGPCIASGNTIILKPASKTPIIALMLGEILERAGVMPGQVNIVPCSSGLAGKLVKDSRIKKLSFTGSAKVGWHLKKQAHLKMKITLELGGDAGAIVHEDADLNDAIPKLVFGAFAFAGRFVFTLKEFMFTKIFLMNSLENFWKKLKRMLSSEIQCVKMLLAVA